MNIRVLRNALDVRVRQAKLLNKAPWVRSVGKLAMTVSTQAWKFPTPLDVAKPVEKEKPKLFNEDEMIAAPPLPDGEASDIPPEKKTKTRLRPPTDMVQFKERLLYLLQPPLEDLFAGKNVVLPFPPYPYQLKGIAFLMPREAALIADEMGLGKTAQVIIALRLMLHGGMLQNALIVCPKPLVVNWTRELALWAPDVPFEVIGGSSELRKAAWFHSKCPVKLVNYELLTRDEDWISDERLKFDVVVLDEAQRIKNKDSRIAKVVRTIPRRRSWAMSGTPD